MKVAVIFLSVSVLLVTLQEVSSIYHAVTSYSSPVSSYSKLVGTDRANYSVWVSRCEELGNGLDIVKIGDNVEYLFINQGHLSDYYLLRYFIGGGTNMLPDDDIRLNQTYGFSDDDLWNIYATTNFGSLGFRSSHSGVGDFSLFSALCEKDTNQTTGQTFSSATSYYHKLGDHRNTFSYWSSQCRELGDGWAPAVIETRRELDFINRAQRSFTFYRTYFIGGYTSFDHLEYFGPCSLDNSSPGSNRVIISTWSSRGGYSRNIFRLNVFRPSHTIPGILCEKGDKNIVTQRIEA